MTVFCWIAAVAAGLSVLVALVLFGQIVLSICRHGGAFDSLGKE